MMQRQAPRSLLLADDAASNSSDVSESNAEAASGTMIHPQHVGDPPCRFQLTNGKQVGCQTDQVATADTNGEIGPAPGHQIDLEAAYIVIGAPRVPGAEFLSVQ